MLCNCGSNDCSLLNYIDPKYFPLLNDRKACKSPCSVAFNMPLLFFERGLSLASAGSKWMFYGEQRNSATWMLKYCASHAPYLQLFPSEHQSHILPFDRVRSRRNHAICKFDFEYKPWVKLKHSRCMLQSNSCWIKANVHRDGFTCFTPSFEVRARQLKLPTNLLVMWKTTTIFLYLQIPPL